MILKRIFLALGICIILVVTFLIYKISTFSIFDDEIKFLEEIKIPSKNYSLKVNAYHEVYP